jgi:hypothetical protein
MFVRIPIRRCAFPILSVVIIKVVTTSNNSFELIDRIKPIYNVPAFYRKIHERCCSAYYGEIRSIERMLKNQIRLHVLAAY